MQRRTMYEPAAWLKAIGPLDDRSHVAYPTSDPRCTEELLWEISEQCGYVVEVGLRGLQYVVRLLPLRGRVPLGQPPLRILYGGPDLRNILAHAAHELALLRSRKYAFTISTKEVQRWVA